MVDYSMGIPVKNERYTLESTVDSAQQQSVIPFKIFICVNGSTDGTLEVARSIARKYSNVCVLESQPGKGRAWNEIMKHNESDLILMTDGDTELNKDAAKYMISNFSQFPELYIVGGNIFIRKPMQRTTFTTLFPATYDQLTQNKFWLSGGIYMMKPYEVQQEGKQYGVSLMPPDIIQEDKLLEFIINQEGRIKIIDEAFIKIQPYTSFTDWYKTCRRNALGARQIRTRYPWLIKETPIDTPHEQEMHDRKEKAGLLHSWDFIYSNFFNYLLLLGVPSKDLNAQKIWQDVTSTKRRIA